MFLSVIIPALNEQATIATVVSKAFEGISQAGIEGEVIVADNSSSDDTALLARGAGAKIVTVIERGYGRAIQGGCAAAKGEWIIISDADNTYDFDEIDLFVNKLKEGYDFIIGNRYKGRYISGSMPLLHRYLGTPLLTFIAKIFFKSNIGDINCGLRAFRQEALKRIACRSLGMEFSSEMIARASLAGLKITEVPCTLYTAPKNRKSHLRTWRDGWRHLCTLCFIFIYPQK